MKKHSLTLMGGLRGELRVPASILHEAVGALIEGARLATRFAVEGESVRKGPRPAWLDTACAIDVVRLSAGSAVIALEAPTLQDVDAARFGEASALSVVHTAEPIGPQTAVDLFGAVLGAVVHGSADDVLADRALLDSCVRFAKLPGDAYEGVRLDGLSRSSGPVVITPAHVPQIELLRDEAPLPQAVRVAGKLDTISASRADVLLELKSGAKIPAHVEDHDPAVLKQLFGRDVVVSGMAHYRASGRLLLVDVESIAEATAADRLFESAPIARSGSPLVSAVAQDDSSGVAAFFGTWPGEESEDELLAALRELG